MSKRLFMAGLVLLAAGGCSFLGANNTYTIPGKWFGYITDTMDLRRGGEATAEMIHQNVAKGAHYVLINGFFFQSYIALDPAEKIAPYAGQTAFVSGVITTNSMTKGPVYSSRTQPAGSDGSAGFGRAFVIRITNVEPHPAEPDAYYVLGKTAGAGSTSSQ